MAEVQIKSGGTKGFFDLLLCKPFDRDLAELVAAGIQKGVRQGFALLWKEGEVNGFFSEVTARLSVVITL